MADNLTDEKILLVALLLIRRQRRRYRASFRKTWVKKWIMRRAGQGAFSNLIRELNEEDPEMFRRYHRLDRASFETILSMVGPLITRQDTNMRDSIRPAERLAATLRFLATGESFRSLSFQFRIGERTLSSIVEDTCSALFHAMREEYMKVPDSEAEWESIAEEFFSKWNYPCCIGAIDGKHIAIQQPPNSGSQFFNYKHFFSVLLMAVVDANYKFVYIDVGAPGRAGDAGVFANSSLKMALGSNTLHLPPSTQINDTPSNTVDYHIIGDEAFPMSTRIMKPFPHRNLDKSMRIYNYRLSRARRVVENAFGILANRFRVFLTTINLAPEKAESLILAACCLHNFLVEKNKHGYASFGDLDVEDTDQHRVIAGVWRNDPHLTGLTPSSDRNPNNKAKDQRKTLMEYFSSDVGSVPWQDFMIGV